MDKRVDNLPSGSEQIPFLNGGLFEPDYDDYYKPNHITGLSEYLNTLKIEDTKAFVRIYLSYDVNGERATNNVELNFLKTQNGWELSNNQL